MATVEATRSDDGGTLAVRVGDRVALRLPENASTGYLWELAELTGLRVVDDGREPAEPLQAGASALRVVTLEVEEEGTHRIEARLRRPWEAEANVADRVTIGVQAT